MFVSKATSKTPAIALITILFMLLAGLSLAGDKNEKSGYLGVMLQDIDSSMAKAMDLDDENGILVSEVIDDSPADMAGLMDGDVIIKFQGQSLSDYKALTKAVGASSPGDEVEVVVLRDGKEITLNVELGERAERSFKFYSDGGDSYAPYAQIMPGLGDDNVFVWHDGDDQEMKIMMKGMPGLHEDRGFMGVELDDISEQMGDYFEVEDGKGALITSVHEDSAADKAGLKAGDIIVKMGDEEIESASDVYSALSDTKADDEMKIEVVRKGKNKSMDLTLGDLPEDQMIKNIRMIGDDHEVMDIRTPKMLFHGMPRAPHDFPGNLQREIRILTEGENDLKEMRKELKKMQKELEKIQEELKNK